MIKKCHNCRNGYVSGGTWKRGKEPKRINKCLYCKGSGMRGEE